MSRQLKLNVGMLVARIGPLIVIISILVISASLGLVLNVRAGLSVPISILSAVTVALGISVLHLASDRAA